MNRVFLKIFFIIFVIPILCSACGQNNLIGKSSIIGDNFLSSQNTDKAIKYKSGTILLKDNDKYEEINQKNEGNSNFNSPELKFGPKDINFERN